MHLYLQSLLVMQHASANQLILLQHLFKWTNISTSTSEISCKTICKKMLHRVNLFI